MTLNRSGKKVGTLFRDLIDAIDVRHAPVTAPARIVSLVPSITEYCLR
ncbi:MAG: hypothetical protein R3F36_14500 [Candidatus Competibacteraceae bacterium]